MRFFFFFFICFCKQIQLIINEMIYAHTFILLHKNINNNDLFYAIGKNKKTIGFGFYFIIFFFNQTI